MPRFVARAAAPPGRSASRTARWLLGAGAVVTVVTVATAASTLGCEPREASASTGDFGAAPGVPLATACAPTPAAPELSPPLVPPASTPAVGSMAALPFAGALAAALPQMADTRDEDSPGAQALALWGTTRMAWRDVAAWRDETTWGLAMKDPDSARGKRLCLSGPIVQVRVKSTSGGKVAVGLMESSSGNLFRFIAVGSSGALVAGSNGRLCGVITGLYDYPNSAGGTGHAVSVVGMFDLPDNRARQVSEPSRATAASPSSFVHSL